MQLSSIIIHLLTSLIIPILIPLTVYFLAKPNLGASVELDENGKRIIDTSRNVFLMELPTAFIANSVWGLSYSTQGLLNDSIIAWNIIYLTMAFFQIIQLIMSKKEISARAYYSTIYIMCCLVIFLALTRLQIIEFIQI